jgi:hypothetical protein
MAFTVENVTPDRCRASWRLRPRCRNYRVGRRTAVSPTPRITASPWLLANGSKAGIAYPREIAVKRNITLEERLIPRRKGRRGGKRRGDLRRSGCSRLPLELREGRDEIARALSCKLPRLATVADIKGHPARAHPPCDGVDTLETMAKAMLARGSEYFDVADHSKSAHYAGGLGADRSLALPGLTEAWRSRASRRVVSLNRCGRFARSGGRSNLPGVAHPAFSRGGPICSHPARTL